jgi:hypothetical protein
MSAKQITSPTDSNSSLHEKTNLDPETPQDPSQIPVNDFGPAPEGGTKAWLNAAGAFCVLFTCLGFTSCFGVLQEYYSTHQLRDHTPSDVAWIGSLTNFIQFSGGAIGGPMFDRYGAKVSRSFLYDCMV